MLVFFPAGQHRNTSRRVVEFPAYYNGRHVDCAISWDALADRYGAKKDHELACFIENRHEIETRVEHCVLSGQFEPNGSILINY